MKIVETHDIGGGDDEYNGKGSIEIVVTDDAGNRKAVCIYAGEPEDAVFYRDLDGAYSIADAIQLAYEAGKRGESLEYEFIDENDDDDDYDDTDSLSCGCCSCCGCSCDMDYDDEEEAA